VTATRNAKAQEVQVQAARIFYEGTFEEYREGLRSTFDVLYAQNSLRETEIALLASNRDSYVAQAVLLRRLGQLEAGKLLTVGPAYDPDIYLNIVRQSGAVPWGGLVRTIDGLGAPGGKPQPIERPLSVSSGANTTPASPPLAPPDLLRGGPTSSSQTGQRVQ
jgi:outer membrane protein